MGSILIIGEPSRELLNPYFRFKMLMLAIVTLITLLVQFLNKKDETFWESKRFLSMLAGGASLMLWIAIITAGRWIAYY